MCKRGSVFIYNLDITWVNMNCSACNKKFSLINTFRIFNPQKFKCNNCKNYLSFDKTGIVVYYTLNIVSICMLFLYIYFIKTDIGTVQSRTCIFFSYYFLATIFYYWFLFNKSKVINVQYT